MKSGTAIDTLASALYSAIHKDLPDIEYKRGYSEEISTRRPTEYDCEVYHFPQTWSSTALGFGGLAGQAFTSSYSTVVLPDTRDVAAVYFGGRFAYLIKNPTDKFWEDVRSYQMKAVGNTSSYRQKAA